MKDKIGNVMNWGISAFSLIMDNSLVIAGLFLINGIIHICIPMPSMKYDAMILSLILALYAAVSIVFVLTDNEKIGKGQEAAGGLVKLFFEGKRKELNASKELLRGGSAAEEYSKGASERVDMFNEHVLETHEKTRSVSRIVMLIIYIVLLVVSIFLVFNQDIAVQITHILIGVVLIAGGIMSFISATSAKQENAYKLYVPSVILSVVSVVLGIVFIILTDKAGIPAYRIVSALLVIKSVMDFVVAFKNRNFISNFKEMFGQIKESGKEMGVFKDEEEKTAETPAEEKPDETPAEQTGKPAEEDARKEQSEE